jgi:hypothetical protein
MRHGIATSALALFLPFVSACFDVEQGLKLNKDLSGEVAFSMSMNMEPIALIMLSMQREMSGQKGDPTPVEIDKAKKEILASDKTRTSQRFPPRALIEKNLPPGVKLLDTSIKEDGLRMTARFSFGFDNVAKLSQIRLPAQTDVSMQDKNPFEHPFPFDIKDEGSTLLLTMATQNPVADQKAETGEMKLPSALQKQLEAAFDGLRIAFRLETPLAVVDHNATRTDGQTLYWEYDLKTLEKMTPQQLAQGVRVRLKK